MLTLNQNVRFSPDNSAEGGSLSGGSLTPAAPQMSAPQNWSREESQVLGTLLLALGFETRIGEVGSGAGSTPREIGGYWKQYVGYEANPTLVEASLRMHEGRENIEFHTTSDFSSSIAKTVEKHGPFSLLFCREEMLSRFGTHPSQQLSQLLQFTNVLAVVTHPSSGQISGTDLHAPSRTTNTQDSKTGFTIPQLLALAKASAGVKAFSLRSAGPDAAVLILSKLSEVGATDLFARMDFFETTRDD
jgi:hypothetical protein